MTGLSIGDLSARTGTKVQTIRYYEGIGLLREPSRTVGQQRRYGGEDVKRLAFIRHSRAFGFSVESIRTLLNLQDDPEASCERIDLIARERLTEVETRIANLNALRKELKQMIASACDGKVRSCRIVETLGDHNLCAHELHGSV